MAREREKRKGEDVFGRERRSVIDKHGQWKQKRWYGRESRQMQEVRKRAAATAISQQFFSAQKCYGSQRRLRNIAAGGASLPRVGFRRTRFVSYTVFHDRLISCA